MNSTAANKKIAVSLFSGVGGFDLGFKAAGFEIAIAIDNNPIALATYHHNFPHTTVILIGLISVRQYSTPKEKSEILYPHCLHMLWECKLGNI